MDLNEIEQQMRSEAHHILKNFPGLGFALIVFEFGVKNGVGSYVTNGSYDDMIKALRETADSLEKNEDIPAIKGNA